jgi:hypothetical protein
MLAVNDAPWLSVMYRLSDFSKRPQPAKSLTTATATAVDRYDPDVPEAGQGSQFLRFADAGRIDKRAVGHDPSSRHLSQRIPTLRTHSHGALTERGPVSKNTFRC